MKPLESLTKDSILSEEVFAEIFGQEDEIQKARMLIALEERAAQLGVKGKFTALVKAYQRANKEMRRRERAYHAPSLENWTNFTDSPYDRMQCREWIATDDGVCLRNNQTGFTDILACYHPILPVERMKNLETGEEQIKLAYKRNGKWQEVIVPKTMVTSASKIVALSGRGISVTSENAKYLVRYLADVENSNEDYIQVQYSSSKLGWIGNDFLPYDTEIIFDGDSRYRQIFESIQEYGNREAWYRHVRELRKSERMEVKLMLAASFSSVLISMLGGLPYFVDLWGETEGGKSVTLMLAASVWADPDESKYIGDFKTTEVALEAKADMLNHLPLMLDDTSKTSARVRDNFEGVVYDLCSGKGKSRSNKDLGINRENRWRMAILTNGERPLNSYVNQGGAMNRILELECGERVYQDPQKTAEIVKKNYGFAGKDFVQVLRQIGAARVREIQAEIQQQLQDDEKMQKQSLSLSIILTADRITEEFLFQDGCLIEIEEAKRLLIDRNEISDNERCYRYILDKVAMNPMRFDQDSNIEKWGTLEPGYAVFFVSAFEDLCREGGFSKKSFLSWAERKGFLQTQSGRQTKTKKIKGSVYRCVFLKLDDGIEVDKDGFMSVEAVQEELPFL